MMSFEAYTVLLDESQLAAAEVEASIMLQPANSDLSIPVGSTLHRADFSQGNILEKWGM